MDKTKILITGSSGFIGRNLVEYIGKQIDRYILFYPSHCELELQDSEKVADFISQKKIDLIIHCASIGGSRKTAYDAGRTDIVSKNLLMFFNICHSMKMNQRMIFLGSGAEYDLRHYKPRMSEDYFDTCIPCDPYGFSKYICSKYIECSKNIVNLRLFGIFGRYEDYRYRFISNSILKNLFGMPIIINQNVYLDYLYIEDLMKIIGHFVNNKVRQKFYNAVSGNIIDLVTIAKKINAISEKPSEIIIKNPGLNTEYSGNNSQLLKEVRGLEFTAFDISLRNLYHWYGENLDKVDRGAVEKDEYLKYCRTGIS